MKRAWLGAATSFFLVVATVWSAGDRSVPVDTRAALVIGTRTVSNYIFEKYYHRFVLTFTSQHDRPPNPDEVRSWLEGFLVQQLVVTEAESAGFLDRAEVKEQVARMERHMLTQQVDLYADVKSQRSPVSEEELNRTFEESGRNLEGIFVRSIDEKSLDQALGENFASESFEGQLERVRRCRTHEGVQVFEGSLSWPYEPLSEIKNVLADPKQKQWVRYQDPTCGTYLFYIRSLSTHPLDRSDLARKTFRQALGQVEREVTRKRLRVEEKLRSRLAVDDTAEKQVMAICRSLPENISIFPEVSSDAIAQKSFFHYLDGPKQVSVSIGEYCRWFNSEIVHRIPRSESELRDSVEDCVGEALSLEFARAQGLDSEPKFAEDRRGFAALQALDLYEKEVLAPQLGFQTSDVERYYTLHAEEFQEVTSVEGRCLVFPSIGEAEAWLKQYTKGAEKGFRPNQFTVLSDTRIEISRGRLAPGLEMIQPTILRSSNGAVFGPFLRGSTSQIFIKERNLSANTVPLSLVESTIKEKLFRKPLDTRERELAVELASQYNIQDNIDYSSFGLRANDLKLPWQSAKPGKRS